MKSNSGFLYRVGLGVFVKSLASFSSSTNATVVRIDDRFAYLVDDRYINTAMEAEHIFPVDLNNHGLGHSQVREVFKDDSEYLNYLCEQFQNKREAVLAA